MEDNQFLQQFGGSATANVVSAIVFILYKFIEGRCKHSSCSSDTKFCKCKTDNYATERGSSAPKVNDVRPQEGLSTVHTRHSPEIQTRRPQIVAVIEPESRDNSRTEFSLVRGGELV